MLLYENRTMIIDFLKKKCIRSGNVNCIKCSSPFMHTDGMSFFLEFLFFVHFKFRLLIMREICSLTLKMLCSHTKLRWVTRALKYTWSPPGRHWPLGIILSCFCCCLLIDGVQCYVVLFFFCGWFKLCVGFSILQLECVRVCVCVCMRVEAKDARIESVIWRYARSESNCESVVTSSSSSSSSNVNTNHNIICWKIHVGREW